MISNNNSRIVTTSQSPLSKDFTAGQQQVKLRPLPARRNFQSANINTAGHKIVEGVPNFVLATKVQLYRSYKVDLTWKRAVHSCSRCPKAQLNTISLVSPYTTHSDVVNRFCPAGVHMGHCTPFSEILHHHTIHRQSISNSSLDKDSSDQGKLFHESQEPNENIYSYAPPNLPHPRLSISSNSSLNNNNNNIATSQSIQGYNKSGSKELEITIRNNNNSNKIDDINLKKPTKTIDTQIIKDYHRDSVSPPLVKAEIDIDDDFEASSPRPRPPFKFTPDEKDSFPKNNERETDNNVFSFSNKASNNLSITNSESSNVMVNRLIDQSKDDYRPDTPKRPEMRTRRGVIGNESSSGNSPQTPTYQFTETKHQPESDLKVDHDVSLELDDESKKNDEKFTPQVTRNNDKPSTVETKPSSIDTAGSMSTQQTKDRKVPILDFNAIINNEDQGDAKQFPTSPTSKNKPQTEAPELLEKPKILKDPKYTFEAKPTSPPLNEIKNTIASYDVIPKFHFPADKSRLSSSDVDKEINRIKKEIETSYNQLEEKDDSEDKSTKEESVKVKPKKRISEITIPYENFDIITKALGVSLYWKRPIYLNCGGDCETDESISLSSISNFWKRVLLSSSDIASRFIYVLTNGKSNHLEFADFEPVIYDIIYTHPGLKFLKSAPDFHHKYVSTVIARIFFCINSSWSGRISLIELRNSNFLSELQHVAEESDINVVTQYFSYEHFYVIYCRFWELDTDHDLIINKEDLKRHNNYAISERMIDRIFSGAVTKSESFTDGIMTYTDFVWFLIAEEDKRHPRSIEYWFRCMDLDGDGLLSMYELEYFYTEQLQRMEEFGTETISFQDTLCQCLDMVKPVLGDKIRLSDLKKCKLCHIFFDIFFNVQKVIRYDTRDPFTNLRDPEDIQEGLHEISDWDRYADEAYDLLTAIECSTDGNMNYDDDDEDFDGIDAKPEKVDSSNQEND